MTPSANTEGGSASSSYSQIPKSWNASTCSAICTRSVGRRKCSLYFSSYFCCVVAMERKEKETEKVRKEGARCGSETIAETERGRARARVKGGVRGEDGAGVRGHARESTSAAVSRWRVSVCVCVPGTPSRAASANQAWRGGPSRGPGHPATCRPAPSHQRARSS